MSEPAGPFKVILHSVDDMWNSRVRSEVSHLFQIDDDTASNIVSAIPIVVIDGLDARTAGIVRERMRPLAATGCRVITTDDPADTIPRVNWPETPEIARVPAEERGPGGAAPADHGPPLATFACPSCGQQLQVTRPARAHGSAAAAEPPHAAHGGALGKPGASAPAHQGKPGANGALERATTASPATAAAPPGARPEATATARAAAAPTPAPAAKAAGEPGAKLAGDAWLDPPLAKKASPAPGTPASSHAPSSAPATAASKPPANAPATPAPAPGVSAAPAAAAAATSLAPAAKGSGSLLDDPLLAVKNPSFADPARPTDVTTLSAKPITSRFSRQTPTPVQQRAQQAQPAPGSTPAPSAPAAPATGRFGPPPATGRFGPAPTTPPTAPRPTERFAAPPPPLTAPPPRPTDRFAAPPPPPPAAAPAPAKPPEKKPAGKGETAPADLELDVHFDEASDLEAAAKLPKNNKDDELRPPSGVDDEDGMTASGRHKPPAEPAVKDDELFDSGHHDVSELAKSGDVSDLLDEPPSATVSRKGAGRLDESEELDLLDDSRPLDEKSGSTSRSKPAPSLVPDSQDPDRDDDDLNVEPDETTSRRAPAAKAPAPAPKKGGKRVFDESEVADGLDDDSELLPPPKPAAKKKGAPREEDFEAALDLFGSDEQEPLDDPVAGAAGRGLEPAPARTANGRASRDDVRARATELDLDASGEDDVPEIQPLDLGPGAATATPSGKRRAAEDPFGKQSSSAILEPLDPNEAMAILKEQNDAPPRPAKSRNTAPLDDEDPLPGGDDEPPGPSGDLEPLDPNEALAILGTDESPSTKTPPRKQGRQKNGRRSDPSKLVPLSASDEDFDFLDDGAKGKGKASKKPDPFARARSGGGPNDETQPPSPSKKKGADPFARARADMSDEPGSKSKGGGSRSERGAPAPAPAKARSGGGGPVPDGDGEHGLVLSRITTESKRQKAAELIAEIKGVPLDDALKLTDRTIIPVLKGVSRDVAEHHLDKFKKNKISGRVTTRQKDR